MKPLNLEEKEEKRKANAILSDMWEKTNLIAKKGMENVVVNWPYNFLIPRLSTENVSSADVLLNTSSSMVCERMSALKVNIMETFLDKVNVFLAPTSTAGAKFYSSVTEGNLSQWILPTSSDKEWLGIDILV